MLRFPQALIVIITCTATSRDFDTREKDISTCPGMHMVAICHNTSAGLWWQWRAGSGQGGERSFFGVVGAFHRCTIGRIALTEAQALGLRPCVGRTIFSQAIEHHVLVGKAPSGLNDAGFYICLTNILLQGFHIGREQDWPLTFIQRALASATLLLNGNTQILTGHSHPFHCPRDFGSTKLIWMQLNCFRVVHEEVVAAQTKLTIIDELCVILNDVGI